MRTLVIAETSFPTPRIGRGMRLQKGARIRPFHVGEVPHSQTPMVALGVRLHLGPVVELQAVVPVVVPIRLLRIILSATRTARWSITYRKNMTQSLPIIPVTTPQMPWMMMTKLGATSVHIYSTSRTNRFLSRSSTGGLQEVGLLFHFWVVYAKRINSFWHVGPGHYCVRQFPQDVAWLSAMRYAQKSVFMSVPRLLCSTFEIAC